MRLRERESGVLVDVDEETAETLLASGFIVDKPAPTKRRPAKKG